MSFVTKLQLDELDRPAGEAGRVLKEGGLGKAESVPLGLDDLALGYLYARNSKKSSGPIKRTIVNLLWCKRNFVACPAPPIPLQLLRVTRLHAPPPLNKCIKP